MSNAKLHYPELNNTYHLARRNGVYEKLWESKEEINEQEKKDEEVAWEDVKKCEDVVEVQEKIKMFESLKRKGLLTGHQRNSELEFMKTATCCPQKYKELSLDEINHITKQNRDL